MVKRVFVSNVNSYVGHQVVLALAKESGEEVPIEIIGNVPRSSQGPKSEKLKAWVEVS
jgi:hypothetical protein